MNLRVLEFIKAAGGLTLILHRQPDGDALGSALALQHAFKGTKIVQVVCKDTIAPVFKKVVGEITVLDKIPVNPGLIIILDCSELHRTGFKHELARAGKDSLVVIDHHPNGSVSKITSLQIRDVRSSSTAEIIFDCLAALRLPISQAMADGLLLGIFTDTGGFRYANTTSKTLKIAARLVALGGRLQVISQAFCEQRSLAKTRLWGEVFGAVTINDFGIAVAKINRELFERTGAKVEDTAGLANTLCLIEEARASLVLVETEVGWRGSFRAKQADVDLGRLARYLGGRGQGKAAGFQATKELT